MFRFLRLSVTARQLKVIWRYKQTEHYRFACYVNWYEKITGWACPDLHSSYRDSFRPLFSRDEMR